MLSFIGFIPAILAFRMAMAKSPRDAFLRVYIPTLLLIPDFYRVVTPGLPDPNANQAVMIALLGVSLMRNGFSGYRYSPLDVVVVVYAICVFNSELQASGYADAQNLMFTMLFSVVMPYFMAKTFIEPHGLRYEFARRVVFVMAIVSMIDVYEAKFAVNPYQLILSRFFPGQGEGWIITFRFGMARTAGPYSHALLAGVMMLVAFRLQRWLHFSGAWPDKVKQLPWLPIKFPVLMTLIVTGGFFITFAKGSWLAGFLAGFLVAVGRVKNRVLALTVVLGFIVFVGIPAVVAFINYASVGRYNAKDENQETACYRYELITGYLDIAKEKATWGWGLTKWPVLPDMPSIDNHYLLLFLMHGKVAFYCFLYILIGTMVRLLSYAITIPAPPRSGGSLAFTLASIYLGYMVAIGTVFMGAQTVPMLFLLTGWAEGYMKTKGQDYPPFGAASAQPSETPRLFRFRRVV
ncbi:MAG: O-antigen ligase family protein [Candidatus Methylumidiphilus sp.]